MTKKQNIYFHIIIIILSILTFNFLFELKSLEILVTAIYFNKCKILFINVKYIYDIFIYLRSI